MAASNTVTLTFAGDSRGLDRTIQHVAAESESLSHQLKDTSSQAKYLKTTMRGAGDAAQLFGGQLGQNAVMAGYALSSVKDLTKGVGGLSAAMTGAQFAVGGIIAVIATAGLALSAHVDKTSMSNEATRTFADTGYYLTKALAFTAQGVPVLGGALKRLNGWFDDASNHAHGLIDSLGSLQDQYSKTAAAQAFLFQQPDVNPGGDATFSAMDAQTVALQAYGSSESASSVRSAPARIRSVGSSIASAAKEAAQKIKDARQSIAEAMGGIVQALAGKLSAADAGTAGSLEHQLNGTFAMVGATRGSSLIEKLKKQAKDTKKLARDLKALAKMGLDKGLLSQLVAGGLDSLPAAEELLRGGKADINTANVLNSQIQGNAGKIAVAEANRNLTKANRVQLDINVKGGTDELGKLLRKWIRTQGGNVQSALGT